MQPQSYTSWNVARADNTYYIPQSGMTKTHGLNLGLGQGNI